MDRQSTFRSGDARRHFREHQRELQDDGDTEISLVWEAARRLTGLLVVGRGTLASAVGLATAAGSRVLGSVSDVRDDLVSYVDPGLWLEDVYALMGVASTGSVAELEERLDEMSLKVEDVARARAREELFLLQQRIAELEALIVGIGNAQSREAVGKLLGRLSDLESRIDALPLPQSSDERNARPSF